ncbi:PEP-CTERM sorting domain-containing protein [Sandaracinobacter neustonicus]|uniref:PEP-CTERM sorting domain-containing protein n=1 Tax=Sandaracinobacter neustonicus TaxID=1715348 RepID=A0A501XU45_9SPHN|nr:PEPxxWA-CTERM sorting domain-containing protein [Sandaracinobacter neustonicus]TPE63607.1 PEP-CTERM sorting domain-containing protein [Sandaracinobacter neustonicus]
MKHLFASIAVLAIATSAQAASYHIKLTGTITEQTHPGYPEFADGEIFIPPANPIQIGDTISFTGQIGTQNIVDFGNGYSVAYFYGAPAGSFNLSLRDYSWLPSNEWLDGDAEYTGIVAPEDMLPLLAAPSLLLKDGKVLGFAGWLVPTDSPVPLLDLGSGYMTGLYDPFGDYGPPGWQLPDPASLYLSPVFSLTADPGTYGNRYIGASYRGIWNFELSSATVPEPGSWLMMIAGFGLIGTMLRRQGRPVAGEKTG